MLKACVVGGALLLPAVAMAQPVQGLYVSGDVGLNVTGTQKSSHDTTKIETNPGPLGIAALGWGFGDGLRAEIEGSVRSNDVEGIETLRVGGARAPLANVSGNNSTYAAMANLEYDVPYHPFGWSLQPYVGAGVGYAWSDYGGTRGYGFSSSLGPDRVGYGTGGAFAYQAILGAAWPLQRNLALTAEYRFFGTAQQNVTVTRTSTVGIPGSVSGKAGFEQLDNAFLIGLRYNFAGL